MSETKITIKDDKGNELVTITSENPGYWKNPSSVKFTFLEDNKVLCRYYSKDGEFLYEEICTATEQ
jgi:hypothetical protein